MKRSYWTGALRVCLLLWLMIGFLTSTFARPDLAAAQSGFVGVRYGSGTWFLHGINMPWIQWGCDFGSGCTWGQMGLRYAARQDTVRADFARLQASNIKVVRWWLFPGVPTTNDQGNVMIRTDGSGKPTSIDPGVFQDIDGALQLAEQYDLYYNFTIFSGPTDIPASWVNDATQRQALADVLGTLFAHYRDNPRIMAWELINEPEWQMGDTNGSFAKNLKDMWKRVIAVQRQSTPALVDIGPAYVAGVSFWSDLDVDFFSPHYYDPMTDPWNALNTTADKLRQQSGTTKPILLGEVFVPPAGNSVDTAARLTDILNRGYAGAWGWSLLYNNTGDKFQVGLAEAKAFAQAHAALIGPQAGNALPTATRAAATATQQPATATTVPATATRVRPTATDIPPTDVPATATEMLPTETSIPPSATRTRRPTDVPATETVEPTQIVDTPTETQEPIATDLPEPTATDLPDATETIRPTETDMPELTETVEPTEEASPIATRIRPTKMPRPSEVVPTEIPEQTVTSLPTNGTGDITIFDDALAQGWQNWSWQTSARVGSIPQVFDGSAALQIRFRGSWAGLYLRAPEPISTSQVRTLRFAVRGTGFRGTALQVWVRADGVRRPVRLGLVQVPAREWRVVELALPNTAELDSFSDVVWQSATPGSGERFALDAITLVAQP